MWFINIIIKFFFGKLVNEMAIVYATLIVKGLKVYSQVPSTIKDQVKEVLIALDCGDLATE